VTAHAALADPAVLAAALDGIGDGVLVVAGGEVLVANRAAEQMIGTAAGGPAPAWVARAAAHGGALDVPLIGGSGRRPRATVTVAPCPLPGRADGELVTIHDRSADAAREPSSCARRTATGSPACSTSARSRHGWPRRPSA